jgi:hypothetical protein
VVATQILSNDEIENHYVAIEHIIKEDRHSAQQVKEHILGIARKMDELITRCEFTFMRSEICSKILTALKQRGLGHLQISVYRMFNDFPEYKRTFQEHSSIHSLSDDKDLPVECLVVCQEYEHALDVLERAKRDLIPKPYYDKYRDRLDDVRDRDTQHYELNRWVSWDDSPDHNPLTELDKLNKSERNHIKRPQIEDMENPLLEALKLFDLELHRLMEKVEKYPMKDRVKAIRCAKGWLMLKSWMRPWTDDKWRADRRGWFLIRMGLKWKSIHAMSNDTVTYDIFGKPREITKEQIADNQHKIVSYASYIMKHLPGFFETTAWFNEATLPYRKELTNITSPKLVKKA